MQSVTNLIWFVCLLIFLCLYWTQNDYRAHELVEKNCTVFSIGIDIFMMISLSHSHTYGKNWMRPIYKVAISELWQILAYTCSSFYIFAKHSAIRSMDAVFNVQPTKTHFGHIEKLVYLYLYIKCINWNKMLSCFSEFNEMDSVALVLFVYHTSHFFNSWCSVLIGSNACSFVYWKNSFKFYASNYI